MTYKLLHAPKDFFRYLSFKFFDNELVPDKGSPRNMLCILNKIYTVLFIIYNSGVYPKFICGILLRNSLQKYVISNFINSEQGCFYYFQEFILQIFLFEEPYCYVCGL